MIIAQKAIDLWINDGRQIVAPSTYSHNIPDKQKIQVNVDNTVNILYKEQLKDKHQFNQINIARGATSDGATSTQ